MATPLLQLEIQGASGNFTFLVPPQFFPRREFRAKAASNAHVTEELVDVWDLRGALLVSTDGTVATLWSQWTAFLARFESRTAAPTYARITRDPGGSNTAVWTLGPSTYERLRFESIAAGSSPYQSQAGHWKVCIPVDLVMSAVLKLADSTTGIVRWDQQVSYSYDAGGLLIIEWRTTVSTKETVDARTKARTYGLIPIASLGSGYSYLTNGDDGVEVEVEDADEQNSRTPTVATGVCRVRQWGVTIGVDGPGVGPSEVQLNVRTRTNDSEEVTSYEVSATGPGAEAWVRNQLPANFEQTESELLDEQATRRFSATWTSRRSAGSGAGNTTTPGLRQTTVISVSGGHADPVFRPALGGFIPIRFTTARQPWTVTVEITLEGTNTPLRSQMQFPAPFSASSNLVLDRAASSEDLLPVITEHAASLAAYRYQRRARLVYRSGAPPPRTLALPSARVESYYL